MSGKPKVKRPKSDKISASKPRGNNTNKMWGGRFNEAQDDLMTQINASITFDRRLYSQDIDVSRAHAQMLVAQNIISPGDGEIILSGLETIRDEIQQDTFPFRTEYEDIHMNIEARLTELVGNAAGRLHTARSRNDQVATGLRLWVREALIQSDLEMCDLQTALIQLAEKHVETIMPGFSHLQCAQPITLGHHLLAYVEMIGRDRSRINNCLSRINECPLGAAAMAGTSFPIDRHMVATLLEFDRPTLNSVDSVSDRDFALEALSIVSIAASHLSRWAEEIIIWSSAQFSFVSLPDSFSTGSSIMPQKRNPDAAELVRAKTGRITGSLLALLTIMKGLPLSYSKDMQEDKEPVFDAFDSLSLCLRATSGMVKGLRINSKAMEFAARDGHSTATELADWLVRELEIPFREAHNITGKVVRRAEDLSIHLEELSMEEFKRIEPRITEAARNSLNPMASTKAKSSYGGTSPDQVKKQIRLAKERFL